MIGVGDEPHPAMILAIVLPALVCGRSEGYRSPTTAR